ncbi:MAG TPA: hypothetical protein VEX60_13680 [Pyrinomonadaceae bacterium]|nr:hypothetical protein [Pyrinomonadaceae bacterium]
MDDQLINRIKRIYAAIQQVEETDFSKLEATTGSIGDLKTVGVNFRGGISDEQINNLAYTAIHNVAYLRDHLKKWAKVSGANAETVEETIRNSQPLKIIIDLAESDKHGYPSRNGGLSGLNPKILKVERFMQGKSGSWVGISFALDGTPTVQGEGAIVISGTVVDADENHLGDLQEILRDAVASWEGLLGAMGIAF